MTGKRPRIAHPHGFVWLVVAEVPDWPQAGPPDTHKHGTARALVEKDGTGTHGSTLLQEGSLPQTFASHQRNAAVREACGSNRSDMFLSPVHRDEAFAYALDLLCADKSPAYAGSGVEPDANAWTLCTRDAVAWCNTSDKNGAFLPDLGTFFGTEPPHQVVDLFGEAWRMARFGVVFAEIPVDTAHARIEAFRRMHKDFALFDRWATTTGAPSAMVLI